MFVHVVCCEIIKNLKLHVLMPGRKYLPGPSSDPYHIETSLLIGNVDQLSGFDMTQVFTERCFYLSTRLLAFI